MELLSEVVNGPPEPAPPGREPLPPKLPGREPVGREPLPPKPPDFDPPNEPLDGRLELPPNEPERERPENELLRPELPPKELRLPEERDDDPPKLRPLDREPPDREPLDRDPPKLRPLDREPPARAPLDREPPKLRPLERDAPDRDPPDRDPPDRAPPPRPPPPPPRLKLLPFPLAFASASGGVMPLVRRETAPSARAMRTVLRWIRCDPMGISSFSASIGLRCRSF